MAGAITSHMSASPTVSAQSSNSETTQAASEATPSPVNQATEESNAEKWKQLSKYIEPLKKMIALVEKEDEDSKKYLPKLKMLLDILTDPIKRYPVATLLKCEKVLKKMNHKYLPSDNTLPVSGYTSALFGPSVRYSLLPHISFLDLCSSTMDELEKDTEKCDKSMKSSIVDDEFLNDLLECPVCLEQLDSSSKVLPCGHTFCKRCLYAILNKNRQRTLCCPVCQKQVRTRIEFLPSNFLLVRLLDHIKDKLPKKVLSSTDIVPKSAESSSKRAESSPKSTESSSQKSGFLQSLDYFHEELSLCYDLTSSTDFSSFDQEDDFLFSSSYETVPGTFTYPEMSSLFQFHKPVVPTIPIEDHSNKANFQTSPANPSLATHMKALRRKLKNNLKKVCKKEPPVQNSLYQGGYSPGFQQMPVNPNINNGVNIPWANSMANNYMNSLGSSVSSAARTNSSCMLTQIRKKRKTPNHTPQQHVMDLWKPPSYNPVGQQYGAGSQHGLTATQIPGTAWPNPLTNESENMVQELNWIDHKFIENESENKVKELNWIDHKFIENVITID